jgi:hypothetical protein
MSRDANLQNSDDAGARSVEIRNDPKMYLSQEKRLRAPVFVFLLYPAVSRGRDQATPR